MLLCKNINYTSEYDKFRIFVTVTSLVCFLVLIQDKELSILNAKQFRLRQKEFIE